MQTYKDIVKLPGGFSASINVTNEFDANGDVINRVITNSSDVVIPSPGTLLESRVTYGISKVKYVIDQRGSLVVSQPIVEPEEEVEA